ncbi:alpha-ketoglutarate-dependent 2,4-dichlorophenoxyacetate dioxygenase [Altererythrobacter atlanticus]|uniref:Alpha-ketoglutarate-dependent 2,4-dichlorophenoxyacetate dioxygenase n=1 Tax=Croceibacterium atlanticum TaxID=1267766 RepID=A0A0F7KUQ0_9SPHN|nr:TauD/TfdA family dioxygenase [Croceibacterium atlanticum]AKH42881.1 Alpha-ketoglutarate-dependent 2,4-dichlorophenoxyacetate dioxygenase [Croceibacterium atlanticum]MBB5731661.1 alpha-ketoglutarate-dependent 2,4-dichlorophenoxyacetate dioxygenase [Croceibacterium atlanticum]
MALQATRLHSRFAAAITGVDLHAGPTDELRDFIEQAMAEYAVCVIRHGPISDQEHLAFARMFGPLELPPGYPEGRNSWIAPELFYAGNLDADRNIKPLPPERNIATGAELFHADSSFNAQPSKWSILRGVECPPPEIGGDTLFVDLRAAYDDLEPRLKQQLDGLMGIHDFWEARRRAGFVFQEKDCLAMPQPAVLHPLVREMDNGRKSLFLGGHCVGVKGWPEERARQLLADLYHHATQDKYIYRHKWTTGDLVIWENRCVLHAATRLETTDYKRDMRRATINEFAPAEAAG